MARILVALFSFVLVTGPILGIEEKDETIATEIFVEKGSKVQLPCDLKYPECDNPQSIKWFRDSSTIFVFDDAAGFIQGSGVISSRASIEYALNSTKSFLLISDTEIEDDGLYKCEVTYSIENSSCNDVQYNRLTITVQPTFVQIYESLKGELDEDEELEPVNEDSLVSFRCVSGEGKPAPKIEWYRNDKLLGGIISESIVGDNGLGNGTSEMEITMSRKDLNAELTCKANSVALDEPLETSVQLNVNVRPSNVGLSGVVGHVIKGTKILLECTANAAKPAANITWFNGTDILNDTNDKFEMFETKYKKNDDTTITTISYLAFTASEYDNEKKFSCLVENDVTRTEDLKPMKETTAIVVLYPPVIKLEETEITVNETDEFLLICDYEANPAALLSIKWMLEDEELDLDSDRYEGGAINQTALRVKNATSGDMGEYRCVLENSVNATMSGPINVSVIFRPIVRVSMDPSTPVHEDDRTNISLSCEILEGNPPDLTAVRWYLDGDLLKELPDCASNSADVEFDESQQLCGIDPSKLLLETVGRSFHGNYSCSGKNMAGWGPMSDDMPLIIYYKPGAASIFYEPIRVIKHHPVNITCTLSDPGRPEAEDFKWFSGLRRLPKESEMTLTIESAGLDTVNNFTCMAYNEVGDGSPATIFIEVSAAPEFVEPLEHDVGYIYNTSEASISCWVECSPICNITWFKDGAQLMFNETDLYYESSIYLPENYTAARFESIESTLSWNLTAWPGGKIGQTEDDTTFTCVSTENAVGPGVNSTTIFHVEYPPNKISITSGMINVTEDELPSGVTCNATGHPDPTYQWIREGSNITAADGPEFHLKTPVPRRSTGTYYCIASNRHGSINTTVVLNVQYAPECRVNTEKIDGTDYIVCSAIANPDNVHYQWVVRDTNDTQTDPERVDRDGKSYIKLNASDMESKIYVCVANNSIGFSETCSLNTSKTAPWWYWFKENILLIGIIIGVLIIVLICLCIIIFFICRRKRNQMKYSNQVANNNQIDFASDDPQQASPQKTFYENLPFHGMQPAPNKPFKTEFSDLDYADVDYRSYGPINYKAASIDLLKRQQALKQAQEQQLQRQLQAQERRPQMYGVSNDNEELL